MLLRANSEVCLTMAHTFDLQEAARFPFGNASDKIAVSVRLLPQKELQVTQTSSVILDQKTFENLLSKIDMESHVHYDLRDTTIIAYKENGKIRLYNPPNINDLKLLCKLEPASLQMHVRISDTLETLETLYGDIKETENLFDMDNLKKLEKCLQSKTFHDIVTSDTEKLKSCIKTEAILQPEDINKNKKRETKSNLSDTPAQTNKLHSTTNQRNTKPKPKERSKRSLLSALLSDNDLTEKLSQDLSDLSKTYNSNWLKITEYDKQLKNNIQHIYSQISMDQRFLNHLESALISLSHDVNKIHLKTTANLRFLTRLHNINNQILDSLDRMNDLKTALHENEHCTILYCTSVEDITQNDSMIHIKYKQHQKHLTNVAEILCSPKNTTHISFLHNTKSRFVDKDNLISPKMESRIQISQLKNETYVNSELVKIKKSSHEGYYNSNLLRTANNKLICLQKLRLTVNAKSVVCQEGEYIEISNTTDIRIGQHRISYNRRSLAKKIRPKFGESWQAKEVELMKWKSDAIGLSSLTETNLKTITINQKRHTYIIASAVAALGFICLCLFACPHCIGITRKKVVLLCTNTCSHCVKGAQEEMQMDERPPPQLPPRHQAP